jgi:hypothetical protein
LKIKYGSVSLYELIELRLRTLRKDPVFGVFNACPAGNPCRNELTAIAKVSNNQPFLSSARRLVESLASKTLALYGAARTMRLKILKALRLRFSGSIQKKEAPRSFLKSCFTTHISFPGFRALDSPALPSCALNYMKHLVFSSLLISLAPIAWSQSRPLDSTSNAEGSPRNNVDRSPYNLFNPTPAAEMRAFAPDRPSVTDAPYTVDPGHWLLEVGLFEYTHDNSDHDRLDGFAFGDTNVRLGVTSCAEVDILFTAYSYIFITDKGTGSRVRQGGFSDLRLRSKINFYGDDVGPFAIGVIPFVTFPSGADGVGNRGFAGGVGLPVQVTLPADFQLGMESTIQSIHEPGGGSDFDYLNSISLGRSITKKLSTYIEFATDISTVAHSSWIATLDTALVYQPANNWQLDAGVNVGVTKSANGLFTFVGAAWRY